MQLIDLLEAPIAYEIKYYPDEDCKETVTEIVGAKTIKEATNMAIELAESEYHVLSVKEIGSLTLKKEDVINDRIFN